MLMTILIIMMMMFQVSPSPECLAAVKRMRTCSACKGLPDLQPCPGLCLNTMKGCLAYHYEIDDLWNKYIGKYIYNVWPGLPLRDRPPLEQIYR